MRRQLIDLSVMVENSPSEPMRVDVRRLDPKRGAWHFCWRVFWNRHLPLRQRVRQAWDFARGRRRILPGDFPDRSFLTLDTITLPTHMGTHVDAPVHYGPRSDGQPGRTIDEMPLDWFYGPGVRLDLTSMKPGEAIEIEHLRAAFAANGHTLAPRDIVLLWTGTAARWGSRAYFSDAPGMSRTATKWLVEQGIKVIGIDTYGFDRPFPAMLASFYQTRDPNCLWPAHFFGREREYVQIERMTNLDRLPPTGFDVACFPLRLRGADASWVRAVAFVDESAAPCAA